MHVAITDLFVCFWGVIIESFIGSGDLNEYLVMSVCPPMRAVCCYEQKPSPLCLTAKMIRIHCAHSPILSDSPVAPSAVHVVVLLVQCHGSDFFVLCIKSQYQT